jgi:beta-galactosidase
MKKAIFILFVVILAAGCGKESKPRNEISLNGIWQIAVTDTITEMPGTFPGKVRVPGLADMAVPSLQNNDSTYQGSVFWYKRTFNVNDLSRDVIKLKINKSMYHTRVFVNGKKVGENSYCFTPSVFDIKQFLNSDGKENELIIAVGCRNDLPDTVTNGWDFEKIKYIPGIYDDVKIIAADFAFINNIQAAPDVENRKLRVEAEIITGGVTSPKINYTVRESLSGKVVASGSARAKKSNTDDASVSSIDFTTDMKGCRLWSPEDPFLYDLEIATKGDKITKRIGMRSFKASPDSAVFLLNERPYYMRGTNVCIFRFFEDPSRDSLPWSTQWVTSLHQKFRDMGWNSIRYCIGFPPERWYEIADSLGFLIQDEFPLWTGGKGGFARLLGGINSSQLSAEYIEWMRERWNHPCVVVWDAQNESVNDTTAKAINIARKYDLSNRPWDNGWAAPASESDAIESHPYLFSRYMNQKPAEEGYLKELLGKPRLPDNDPNAHSPAADGKRYANPVILNEYGWIWLNRNGTTTTLTDKVYQNVFPEADNPNKRMETYAKNLAMLTEYWRSYRHAAAVMHFCGLGYSRPEEPRGQTSDNFIDIANLTFEPSFYQYVKPAFSPVGLMQEFWEKSLKKGEQVTIPVHIINDTYLAASGALSLTLLAENEVVSGKSVSYSIDGLKKTIIDIPVKMPERTGKFRLEAEIIYKGTPVRSIREFEIR